MSFVNKLKECSLATLSILLVVFAFMACGVIPFAWDVAIKFVIGAGLLVIGQALFLVGVDAGIVKIGQVIGNSIVRLKNLASVLAFAFLFGFLTTIAEPDVNILVGQVVGTNDYFLTFLLLFLFGLGVGSFVMLGMVKVLKKVSLKVSIVFGYLVVLVLLFFTPENFIGISFDGGGVTTGPITSPFLLAMTIALAGTVGAKRDSSFGMITLASIGAIIFLEVFFIICGDIALVSQIDTGVYFWELAVDTLSSVALVYIPLISIFCIYNWKVSKISRTALLRIFVGVGVSFVGLILFLIGVNYGFLNVGYYVGSQFGQLCSIGGSVGLLLLFVSIIGVLIVYTEPNIIIFAEQIAIATSSVIKRNLIIAFVAVGVAIACCLSVFIIVYNLPLWIFLLVLYLIAVILGVLLPQMFTGMSFDAGGVASGTMAAAFILPFMTGLGYYFGNVGIGFGVLALIAVVPIITFEILSIIFVLKQRNNNRLMIEINNKIYRKSKDARKSAKIFIKSGKKKQKEVGDE